MADIAFLLLIFFLVTTTIINDQGIMMKLPPWDPNSKPPKLADRNVCRVSINFEDELFFRGNRIKVDQLNDKVKEFISNPRNDKMMAKSPKKAVISLKNDRATTYKTYIAVYDELKKAYHELRDERSIQRFGKSYDYCSKFQRQAIKDEIPLIISEAEPSDFGTE